MIPVRNNPLNLIDPLGLIDFYPPSVGDNSFFDGTANCGIIGTCRKRLDDYADRNIIDRLDIPKKRTLMGDVLKTLGKSRVKDLLENLARDQACAIMNSARCNGDMDKPIWPPKPPEKLKPSGVCE